MPNPIAGLSPPHGMTLVLRQVEHIVPPTDGHNTAGEIDPHIHSHHGYVNITLPNAKFPSDSHAIATTQDLPDEFPFNLDSNSGNPIGLGE